MPTFVQSLARSLVIVSTVLALSAADRAVQAQSPVSVTAEVNVLSQYFFAGIPFATGGVSQGRVTVATPGGLTLNAFSVYDYDASSITEFDVYGDFYLQLAPTLGFFVGAALYNFDLGTTWEGTPEVYGGLVLAAPLNPTLYVAHDFDLGDGTHVTLTASESRPLGTSGATLDLGGNLEFNNNYYTVDFSGFSFANLGASIGFPVGPVTVSPSVVFIFALDGDFQAQAGIDDVEEVLGLTASWTF